ncbi:MAG: metal-dependent hydrolase [Thiolinea sp.]
MDPVSQGVVGAVLAQTRGRKRELAKAAVIGAIAAMAPDLDVLIQSADDSLLALEFHRQFTHSILFVPLGGLLCSLFLYPLLAKRWGLGYAQTLVWCIIGYATHGMLDGCTSYGTQLLWPLSNQRFSWDIISIIDPLFTLPLLAFCALAAWKQSRNYVKLALLWGGLYLTFGYYQHTQAIEQGHELAAARGHEPLRLEAKPSFANLLVWKVIYETGDRYYVDAIRPGWPGKQHWPGQSIPKLDIARDLPWLDADSQQAIDIERFRWFSAGYLAIDPDKPNRVVDMRYSLLPHQIKALWGIQLTPGVAADQHATYITQRGDSRSALGTLWQMIWRDADKP